MLAMHACALKHHFPKLTQEMECGGERETDLFKSSSDCHTKEIHFKIDFFKKIKILRWNRMSQKSTEIPKCYVLITQF